MSEGIPEYKIANIRRNDKDGFFFAESAVFPDCVGTGIDKNNAIENTEALIRKRMNSRQTPDDLKKRTYTFIYNRHWISNLYAYILIIPSMALSFLLTYAFTRMFPEMGDTFYTIVGVILVLAFLAVDCAIFIIFLADTTDNEGTVVLYADSMEILMADRAFSFGYSEIEVYPSYAGHKRRDRVWVIEPKYERRLTVFEPLSAEKDILFDAVFKELRATVKEYKNGNNLYRFQAEQ